MNEQVATWQKSSYSSTQTNCVEVGRSDDRAAIRDSKNPTGAPLIFRRGHFESFLEALKHDALSR